MKNKRFANSLHKFHRYVTCWLIASPCETLGIHQASPSFTCKWACETWWTLREDWSFTGKYCNTASYVSVKLVKAVFASWLFLKDSGLYIKRKDIASKTSRRFLLILFCLLKHEKQYINLKTSVSIPWFQTQINFFTSIFRGIRYRE